MAKQVIDIVPAGEIPVSISSNRRKKNKKQKRVKQKKVRRNSANGSARALFYTLLVLIVVAGGVVGFLTWQSKLVIKISPVLDAITLSEEVEASIVQEKIDFVNKIIPAQSFETEQEKWSTFKSTGSDTEGAKAQGIITVYNNYNPPRAVTLVKNTRFLSAEGGKTFRALDKVYIKPAKLDGGKITPSSADVKVIAQEGGDSYNIGPSKFSVPGLAGSALYYSIWGESKKSMEGGFSSAIKKVTQDDLDQAKKALRVELEKTASSALRKEAPKGVSIGEGSISIDNFESSCFQEPGEKAPEFNCYGKAKISGIGIKDDDLKEIGREFINGSMSPDQRLDKGSLNVAVKAKSGLTESGSMIFDIDINGLLYKKVNEQALVSAIAGQDKDSIKLIINSGYPQIKTLELNFWPFWVKKAPKKLDKIKVKWVAGE